MTTVAIMNQKGGTAKTVTAINLAANIAKMCQMRVLLADADCQANLSEFVMNSTPDGFTTGGMPDLLRGMEAFPLPTKIENVKILHADESLMELDITKAGNGEVNPMVLADWLKEHDSEYDYCIIDCPPAFSAAGIAALIAADCVVIPLKLDAFGIRGMAMLLAQVRNMQKINPDLKVAGVLPTMFYKTDQQMTSERELRATMAKHGIHVFRHIRRSPKVDDMTFAQEPLCKSSPTSAAAKDYWRFTLDLVYGGDV